MSHDTDTDQATITYLGGGGKTLFAEDVTITVNGNEEQWNGDTNRGALDRGSTHVATDVHPSDTIVVIADSPRHEDTTRVEYTA